MRGILLAAALLSALAPLSIAGDAASTHPDPLIARGRTLVAFGACNDCHTPGWRESDGNVPVQKWMVGNSIGLLEPWGTEYPINVRQWFAEISESQWLFSVHTRGGRMQWHDIRALSPDDQRAIYRFIRNLGPAGAPAPLTVPPEREPSTPYIDLRVHTPAPRAP
jgi:mono/diheme cytochrome c family protein